MDKHIRHMLYFVEIVEAGSISGAAARLGTSKSVVSLHLKTLESELGLTLLTRSTRQQSLTSTGQQFYKRCREMHDVLSQAWQEARDHQQLALGTLRISAPHALIGPIVAPAIGDLVSEHEGITPFLMGNDNRANLIEDKIDLAIRVGKMPSSEYKQKKIGGFNDVLCASPEYLKKHNISPEQMLAAHLSMQKVDYVANSWQGTQITHALKHKQTQEVVKLSFTANRNCNSLLAVVAMVRAGCGFAFIPDFVFHPYEQSGELVQVFPDYVCEYAPVYAVYAYKGQPPTLVRLAIDAIKKKLGESMED
ncbi:LysR family transcriptional regulator [Aquirhabdus parva]|uniref:LysR family transcriptional regulator n=1 Tax=Aquirhabdus parva TaxID=2283318 RepID=A0A345P9Q4_9GAMM|nr:LysR family transcriptional regulator [Aquirhabdus parva]AXI04013.1 LysR family transcriptional regulator [Aquirhabdus parva]